jgi:hypothetical protein
MHRLWLAFLLFITTVNCFAVDGIYLVALKKVEAKKARGWSLTDWMLTKQKVALMDQWLALNSSANNFEFFISGGKSDYDRQTTSTGSDETTQHKMDWAQAGAYFRIFGIEGGSERTNEHYTSRYTHFALRIFGTAVQGTNITAHYGIRKFKGGEIVENQYWGGRASLYLLSFLGVDGTYHEYLSNKSSQGNNLKGDWMEYGAFFDLWPLRPRIAYFEETSRWSRAGVEIQELRKGVRLDATLFF